MNKKHLEQQMALQCCQNDSNLTGRVKKEISELKMREEFLKRTVAACNTAIGRDTRKLEMLKNEQKFEMEMSMDWT